MDPMAILTESSPLRMVVIEAVVDRLEKEDAKARKSLANQIANEVVSRIKFK